MPRPRAVAGARGGPAAATAASPSSAAFAAARIDVAQARDRSRCRSRYSTGSAFTCAATSSMKHSCANVFCSRSGARSGPVKNGDSDAVREHALAAHRRPRRCAASPTRPAMYDGAVFDAVVERRGRRRRRRARRERRGLEAGEQAR